MTIALKLLVADTEAALAAATSPRERASLKNALNGYKRTLDAAVSDPEPRAARAPTVDPETGADVEAPKTCSGCGESWDQDRNAAANLLASAAIIDESPGDARESQPPGDQEVAANGTPGGGRFARRKREALARRGQSTHSAGT